MHFLVLGSSPARVILFSSHFSFIFPLLSFCFTPSSPLSSPLSFSLLFLTYFPGMCNYPIDCTCRYLQERASEVNTYCTFIVYSVTNNLHKTHVITVMKNYRELLEKAMNNSIQFHENYNLLYQSVLHLWYKNSHTMTTARLSKDNPFINTTV